MRNWVVSDTPDGVYLTRAADEKPRPVQWLWHNWIPREDLSLLAGPPATGKTTIAMTLASIVSRGEQWPDDLCVNGGEQNVVIWSGEDSIPSTLIPRLIAADAKLSRVHFVTGIQEGGKRREFDPATDIFQLTMKISEIGGAGLVIIDPLISAVAGDAHKANDVRRDLADLCVLGRTGSAVLGITHFSKRSQGAHPLERVLGSQAFGALARAVLVTAKRADSDERVLLRAKNNLGPDGGGFTYQVRPAVVAGDIETSFIEWGSAIEGDVENLMAEVDRSDLNTTRLEEAKAFLMSIFEQSECVAAREVFSRAEVDGHAKATINRAKFALNIKVEKRGGGGWFWRLSKQPTSST